MKNNDSLLTTGVAGLDEILCGGLTRNRIYLLQGTPGSGKTTFALQFLLEGIRKNEKVLYITLSESKIELIAVAKSHGWSLDGIDILELIEHGNALEFDNQNVMYEPYEVELSLTTKAILERVEHIKPSRMVIDSLSEIKLMAQTPLHYRRQVLAFREFFLGQKTTALFIDDDQKTHDDMQLQSIVHGVIRLEQFLPGYGREKRRLSIQKFRGQYYQGGYHDFKIQHGGLIIFPRLHAAQCIATSSRQLITSGIKEFDALLGDGLDSGTSVLLLGPAGVGKSTLAMQYAAASAEHGQRSVMFIFDEQPMTLMKRAASIGLTFDRYVEAGLIKIQSIDPTEVSPGEFAHIVKQSIDGNNSNHDTRIVIIDSLNGYLNAMPEERFLITQLHELLTFLDLSGVLSFLIVAQHGVLNNIMQSPVDTSYLADTVILFRYFESAGTVKQAVSIVKKRFGSHERTIREFKINSHGISVSEPLVQFENLLTGSPTIIRAPAIISNER